MPEVDFNTFTDVDFNQTQNSPIPLGANALHMQIRAQAGDPTVWAELNTANGRITVQNGTPDIVSLFLPQSVLNTIPPGQYVYSLVLSTSTVNGFLRTEVFRGVITHAAGPTQWPEGTL